MASEAADAGEAGRPIKASHSKPVSGQGKKVVIVYAQWNKTVIDSLVQGAQAELEGSNAEVILQEVPGSYELPFGAKCMIQKHAPDAVICVGCLIKGSTMHFEYICEAVSQGIMRLQLDSGVPVVFGVLTCLTEEQALERAGLAPGKPEGNHGPDWARTALTMAQLAADSKQ